VLFNKLYVKLGATYKLVAAKSGSISFDYFSHTSSNLNGRSINDKLNLAFSFTTESELYYLSFSSLNLDLPWNKTIGDLQFPRYYMLNIGNLMSVFGTGMNKEISYSAFSKLSPTTGRWSFGHYINLKNTLPLSRVLGVYYGTRIGYLENKYYHTLPFITLYKNEWSINVSYDFRLDKTTLKKQNFSTAQISLIYKL
jgi:hypothetical protein